MTTSNRLTSTTFPAIAKFDYPATAGCARHTEWKVSPFGPVDPDRASVWADSRGEAETVAIAAVVRPRLERDNLNAELDALRSYLMSPKFAEDTTVQVSDILTRLEQLRNRAVRLADEGAHKAIIEALSF